ncbi:MAG: AIDA repeat-containing protein, partial [Lentisphaeria bacterium]|nr:AIDA repeat-containing protein [Lentisphaeria bacterium]
MTVHSNTVSNSTTVNDYGNMYISDGVVANSTTVNDYGYMYIYDGGVADSTTVNSWGYMYISSGGVASNTTVSSGGSMYISSGGSHRGSLNIESGAVISAYSGAIVDFTVKDRKPEDDYLINDLSLIAGTPTYTITVTPNQAAGTYKLAQGASSFTGSVTVGDGTINYGRVAVNGADLTYGGNIYSLDQAGGDLTLSISIIDTTPPVKPVAKANITAATNKNVTVTASFSKDSTVKQYSLDKKSWKTYTSGIVMKNNGTVYFRGCDNAGNYSAVTSYTVKNIVTVPVAKANITAPTTKNVTVTATFSKNSTLEQFSLDKKTWKTYTKGIVFKKNGSVYFRAADAALNYTAITSYTVKNIDTAKPKINKVTATVKGYSATLKISATDNTKVAKYVVTYGKISKTITSNSLKLNNLAVGKVAVSVVAYDAAGNKSSAKKVNLTIKDATPPSKVTTLKNPSVTGKYKGTFSWSAAKDNSGKIAGYEIQIDGGKIYKSTKTTLSVNNLAVGKHTYRVRAIDKDKNVGAWSANKAFTVKDMTAPSNVAVKVKVSGNNAVLTWKKPKDNVGVTKYILKYGSKTVTLKGSVTKYAITGLNKGKYSYSMVAVDAANNKSKAKTGKITIKQPLAPARAAEALYAADFAAPEA